VACQRSKGWRHFRSSHSRGKTHAQIAHRSDLRRGHWHCCRGRSGTSKCSASAAPLARVFSAASPQALLLAAPSRMVRLALPSAAAGRLLRIAAAGLCLWRRTVLAIAPSMPSQGRIRRGRHGQLPQIPGTLQIERSLAPTRRPFVCSCTAALLIADYEEMGFLEPAPRPRLPVALVADASRSSV
jgi:hypothetical protein